ncbi:MAG: sigma-70 family RNA polymerase sigma factor [Gammaproteobacteria bacterium]|nr:sigma-70 family RNA polymerase sigma factor [Gammaproteobacteria bacterium]
MTSCETNQDFFRKNIEQHLDRLYGAALGITRNPSEAEDLVAETVTKAWTCIDSLQDTSRFVPWMKRIMTNLYISSRRKAEHRAGHERYIDEADCDEPFSLFERLHQPFLLWWGNPEQEFLDNLLGDDIDRALESLPESFRIVIRLADAEGMTYQEIAETLSVPVGTVRSRLARARSLMQKALWIHAVDRGLVEQKDPEAAS